ncbi:MAG: mobile mystery protein A [Glomeribacter sp. 1016415]|nr:mobile mystery protein A [Glomeribacter sp. 1016415]
MTSSQYLRLNQVRRSLDKVGGLKYIGRPPGGWLRTIREALGLSIRQQAVRSGISSTTLYASEKKEAQDRITIAQLRKLAASLDCELVYAIVPHRDLAEVLAQRAEQMARTEVLAVSHTMVLENQAVRESFIQDQIAERKQELLDKNWGRLWD